MNKRKQSPTNASLAKYAYYSGVGFQMLAIIGVCAYIGHRIDESKQADKPIFTAVFALVGVCISIYTVVRMVIRRKRP